MNNKLPIDNLLTTSNGGQTNTNNYNNAGNATDSFQQQFQQQLAAVPSAKQQQQQQQNTTRYFSQFSHQPGNKISTNTTTRNVFINRSNTIAGNNTQRLQSAKIISKTPNISQQQQQNASLQQIVLKAHNTTATITRAQLEQQLQLKQQQQQRQQLQQQQIQQQQASQILPHSVQQQQSTHAPAQQVQQQHRYGLSILEQIKINQYKKLLALQKSIATTSTAAPTNSNATSSYTNGHVANTSFQQTIVPNGTAANTTAAATLTGQQEQATGNAYATDPTGGTTAAAVEGTEPDPAVDIVINNVVCSFSVRCQLNLREIALNGANVEFRRENGMVTMKLRRPYTTASIWSSGRITCTGATSECQALVAARRYARRLQKLGFPVRFQNFRVVNVLGTCSMPWAIKIVNFSEKYRKDASYEPELHPGVTYKLLCPKATLKIFSTGSITVTASSVANVEAAIQHIYPLVYEFRKQRSPQETEQLRLKRLNACLIGIHEPDEYAMEEIDDVASTSNKAKTKLKQPQPFSQSCKRRRLSSKEDYMQDELLECEADDPDGAADDDSIITEDIEELMEVDHSLNEYSDVENADDLIEELEEEVFRHHVISKSVQIVRRGTMSVRKC